MEFNDNKPIYRQIADYAFNCILERMWLPEERIPSVRELAADLGVNSRTVLKALEYLQNTGVITPRRGMGFILEADAVNKVLSERRREFYQVTVPALREEMRRLNIKPLDLARFLENGHSLLI